MREKHKHGMRYKVDGVFISAVKIMIAVQMTYRTTNSDRDIDVMVIQRK